MAVDGANRFTGHGQVMRAAVADAFGCANRLHLSEAASRTPQAAEVLVAVAVAGVSAGDALVAAGGSLPYIPGTEFAGIVASVGQGVSSLRPGDRVAAVSLSGAYAEQAIASVDKVIKLPHWMDFTQGAVFYNPYATAYHALVQCGRLAAAETILVLGAGGAVGIAAIQLAKALGGVTIASASSEAKRALARAAGADHAVDCAASNWRGLIREITGGRGVDIVVDPINGAGTERAFRSLAWGGRHLVIGSAAGTIGSLPTNLALLQGASLIGVDLRQFASRQPQRHEENLKHILSLFERRSLHCHIARRYDLHQIASAMQAVRRGEVAGRVVLDIRRLEVPES